MATYAKPSFVLLMAIFAMFFLIVNCDVVDDVSCANHVHKECKCGFGELYTGNKKIDKNWCNKLQACADCMSVPRCFHMKYLSRFIYLLLATLKMTRITNLCPGIRYQKLQKIKEGFKCQPSKRFFYDECGHRCVCLKGYVAYCKRIRKEFTEMSLDERRRFVDAYYKATTDPNYKSEFYKLLNFHSEIPSGFLHDMPHIFFPWHRWHLLKIENFLRRIDCRVTAPYYQWTARVDDKTVWRTSDPSDVWYGGAGGLGGNGVKPSRCVQDGKFREGNWWVSISKGGGCLRRDFDFKCHLYNQKRTDKLLTSSFHHFEKVIRGEHHATFHNCIGGVMPDNTIASNAPEYILHHSFIDKLWDSFQSRGNRYKYAYYPSINFRMPFADMRGVQLLDNDNLPGNVAVGYKDMKKRKRHSVHYFKDDAMLDPDLKWNDETVFN